MQSAHLHLMLNHLPVVGVLGVTLLFAYATLRRHDEVTRVALMSFVLIAVLAGVVFLTGEPAEEIVESLAGIDERAIHAHEESASIALWACVFGGALSLVMLALYRGRRVPRLISFALLLMAASASTAMGIAANLGGQIRHTEIVTTAPVAAPHGEGR